MPNTDKLITRAAYKRLIQNLLSLGIIGRSHDTLDLEWVIRVRMSFTNYPSAIVLTFIDHSSYLFGAAYEVIIEEEKWTCPNERYFF